MSIKAKTLVIVGLITAGLLALFGLIVAPTFAEFRRIRRAEAELQKPALYEPVGKTLALYCQSYDGKRALPDHWLPDGLKELALGPGYTFIESDEAFAELGGGFHDYGYSLGRDERASSPGTTV